VNKHPHVAIDGPAASGKTTVAREVATRLGALYLDTGAMYRAVALLVLRAGADPADEAAVMRLLAAQPVSIEPDRSAPRGYRVYCGDVEPSGDLFSPRVEAVVSTVAAHPRVREALVRAQRAVAARGAVVMAGRDIGTVVLPEAPVKVYLTASPAARAARRVAELAAAGTPVDPADVVAALDERDRVDGDRAVAPLRPAPGATIIDSSDLTAEQVADRVVALARGTAG
jgi:cytidylate kinase